MGKRWLPLESNPDVLTSFAATLGLDTSQWAFTDVFGLDEELLQMVPQPVIAVLLLFPITEASEAAKDAEDTRIAEEGQQPPAGLYYMKQTIGNACGTIALLHAVGNNLQHVRLADASFLRTFFADTADMTPAQRAAYLEQPPPGAPDIDDAHQAAAQTGDTAAPSLDEVVQLHFVALVEAGGRLMQLDGRRKAPVDHGPTTPDTLLQDSARVVQQFMSASSSINFNVIALAAAQS